MTASRSLQEAIASLAASARHSHDVDETLERLTNSAVDTIPGVDYCSVSMRLGHGVVETLAPTHPLVVAADELQYELHEGPCYEVVTEVPVLWSNDLASEERWPQFGPQAAGLGSDPKWRLS